MSRAIILSGDISTDTLREIAAQGRVHLGKPVTAAALIRLAHQLLTESAPRRAGPPIARPRSL